MPDTVVRVESTSRLSTKKIWFSYSTKSVPLLPGPIRVKFVLL